jgi:aminoglycoside phosphotransferase (APT) family kinase protein
MINNKKLLIDTPLVQRLVQTQFPQWQDLPIKPVTNGGWDNRMFHLGEHMVVRTMRYR